jgi:hypothetical protein
MRCEREIAPQPFFPCQKEREGARSQSQPVAVRACVRVRVRRHSGKDGSRRAGGAPHPPGHHARAADSRRTHVVSLFPQSCRLFRCQMDVLADLMDGAMPWRQAIEISYYAPRAGGVVGVQPFSFCYRLQRAAYRTLCHFHLRLGKVCHVPKRPGACLV